jgi:hypothetical protein
MSTKQIENILNMTYTSLNKQINTFRRVDTFLSYFVKRNLEFDTLNLPMYYFQKILIVDWNEVLFYLNRVVQSISNT